jgi:hypothetical protein
MTVGARPGRILLTIPTPGSLAWCQGLHPIDLVEPHTGRRFRSPTNRGMTFARVQFGSTFLEWHTLARPLQSARCFTSFAIGEARSTFVVARYLAVSLQSARYLCKCGTVARNQTSVPFKC